MKLVSYRFGDEQVHLGAIIGQKIVNLNRLSAGELPDSMLEFLQSGDSAMQTAKQAGFGEATFTHTQSEQGGRDRPELHGSYSRSRHRRA
jgi:hypothetical protein